MTRRCAPVLTQHVGAPQDVLPTILARRIAQCEWYEWAHAYRHWCSWRCVPSQQARSSPLIMAQAPPLLMKQARRQQTRYFPHESFAVVVKRHVRVFSRTTHEPCWWLVSAHLPEFKAWILDQNGISIRCPYYQWRSANAGVSKISLGHQRFVPAVAIATAVKRAFQKQNSTNSELFFKGRFGLNPNWCCL